MDDASRVYIEGVALFWEQQGLPRIAGRIVALLLICEPEHRSATQLAAELEVAKGSVSTMTRLLLSAGSIERVAIPGDRATYFRLAVDGFEQKFKNRALAMTGFRALADRGLDLLKGESGQRRARLVAVRGLYAFMERELPALLDKWQAERSSWLAEDQEGDTA